MTDIFSIVQERRNVLLYGPGGTGKSYALKTLKKDLEKSGYRVALTATTGIAAINIGGITLHRWAGIGLGKDSVSKLARTVRYNTSALDRWLNTDILIIDEVSMLGSELFDKLEELGRVLRSKRITKPCLDPFGGITLVCSGDFLQLPPVNDRFVFESERWDSCDFQIIDYTTPYRYPDPDYFQMLLRFRRGEHTEADIEVMNERHQAYLKYKSEDHSTDIQPTHVYSRRYSVEDYNIQKLNELDGQEFTFRARDTIQRKTKQNVRLDSYKKSLDTAVPAEIVLKVGAQVMLTANLNVDAGLANGSRGIVVRFDTPDPSHIHRGTVYPVVKFVNGEEVLITDSVKSVEDDYAIVFRSQVPLSLAWATTIHRCQGLTLDYIIADLGPKVFAEGMAYTALSRCRELKGLLLKNFTASSVLTSEKALEFH